MGEVVWAQQRGAILKTTTLGLQAHRPSSNRGAPFPPEPRDKSATSVDFPAAVCPATATRSVGQLSLGATARETSTSAQCPAAPRCRPSKLLEQSSVSASSATVLSDSWRGPIMRSAHQTAASKARGRAGCGRGSAVGQGSLPAALGLGGPPASRSPAGLCGRWPRHRPPRAGRGAARRGAGSD